MTTCGFWPTIYGPYSPYINRNHNLWTVFTVYGLYGPYLDHNSRWCTPELGSIPSRCSTFCSFLSILVFLEHLLTELFLSFPFLQMHVPMWIVLLVVMAVEPAVALEKAKIKYFWLKSTRDSPTFHFWGHASSAI